MRNQQIFKKVKDKLHTLLPEATVKIMYYTLQNYETVCINLLKMKYAGNENINSAITKSKVINIEFGNKINRHASEIFIYYTQKLPLSKMEIKNTLHLKITLLLSRCW